VWFSFRRWPLFSRDGVFFLGSFSPFPPFFFVSFFSMSRKAPFLHILHSFFSRGLQRRTPKWCERFVLSPFDLRFCSPPLQRVFPPPFFSLGRPPDFLCPPPSASPSSAVLVAPFFSFLFSHRVFPTRRHPTILIMPPSFPLFFPPPQNSRHWLRSIFFFSAPSGPAGGRLAAKWFRFFFFFLIPLEPPPPFSLPLRIEDPDPLEPLVGRGLEVVFSFFFLLPVCPSCPHFFCFLVQVRSNVGFPFLPNLPFFFREGFSLIFFPARDDRLRRKFPFFLLLL